MDSDFTPVITPLGDRGLLLRWGDSIDERTRLAILSFCERLEANPISGFLECVPAFVTVAIFYDPLVLRYETARSSAAALASGLPFFENPARPVVEIPVCYGIEYGPDLPWLAEFAGLPEAEVVRLHRSAEYRVHMIGFAPGFPYLGGLPKAIAAPRRETPRLSVPEGSVGIAGEQTGIYSVSSPGGWRIIGRTPMRLFRPWAVPPSLLQAGDRVRFVSIAPDEFENRDHGAEGDGE
jgi:inhibitor of KinA